MVTGTLSVGWLAPSTQTPPVQATAPAPQSPRVPHRPSHDDNTRGRALATALMPAVWGDTAMDATVSTESAAPSLRT